MATVLNTHTADDDFDSPFLWVKVCAYCRLFGLFLTFALPILLFIPFYCIKRDKWNTKEFRNVYGVFLEGTRVELREREIKGDWVMLLRPIIFLYRRLTFITCIIYFRNNILALILIQIGMIQFWLSILHLLRTFESKAALWK